MKENMNALTIGIFMATFILIPIVLGYIFRKITVLINPQSNLAIKTSLRSLLQGLCLAGTVAVLLVWKGKFFNYPAMMMFGAIFIWPTLFLLTWMPKIAKNIESKES